MRLLRRIRTASKRALVPLLLALLPACALAGGGPFGIDSELPRSDTGIWNRGAQVGLEDGAIVVTALGALWFGNDDPLGHVFWQSADAMALSGLSAQALKYAFSRARPSQGDNPNLWFQGHGHESFPSGEVTEQASFVTPFIINYQRSTPWIWALEILPAYDAIARLKSQAHWQSDVIVGGLLGAGFGYWATTWRTPLLVRVLPRGVTIGLAARF
jgi:membrane-associated phospholipid phosphatase